MKEWMKRKIKWANSRTWGEILLFVIVLSLVGLLLWGGVEWIKANGVSLDVASAGGRGQAQVQHQPQKDPSSVSQNTLIPNEYYVKDSNTVFHTGELQNEEEKRFVWHQLGLAELTVNLNSAGQVKLTQEIEKLLLAVRKERVEKELHQPRYRFDYLLRSGDVAQPSDWEKTRMLSNHELKLIRDFMKDDCPSILGPGPVYHLTRKAARALVAYRKANPVKTDDEVQVDPPTRVLPIAGNDDTEVVARLTRHGRRDRRGRVNRATDRTRRLRADRSEQTQARRVNPGPPVVRVRTNYDHDTRVSSDGRTHVVEVLSQ